MLVTFEATFIMFVVLKMKIYLKEIVSEKNNIKSFILYRCSSSLERNNTNFMFLNENISQLIHLFEKYFEIIFTTNL